MENRNPFEILTPYERWVPTRQQMELYKNEYEQLLPPLVHKIREAVYKWRDDNYDGASQTTKSLFNFWFNTEHKNGDNVFQFYFSQREAIESIVYLYEIAEAKDKYDLMRFDSSERISTGMFQETWTRYVVKMATGTGKTKVMGLALVWSYFQKLYETESPLSKNFLIIAPNIIVLNRLKKDFDNLTMFREEPFIPDNGFDDRDWKNDFQLTVHIQDDVKPITDCGNLFLTNIHRVYLQDEKISPDEEFLGTKPKADADTSKGLDLGKILRSGKLKDLVVMNDEAHHIHDSELEWFKCIEEISNKLKLRFGNGISLQVDCTATPRHTNGGIFVQTICDYPLVEAIRHQVVKSPVLPDEASRSKISEKPSGDFVERYQDFIRLGYIEWKKQYDELKKLKTPILFIMTTNTSEADQTAEYLEATYSELKGAVLTIHTNKSGDINETSKNKQDKDELDKLRKAADEVDKDFSPYKAVVSVLMLREGWDVKNVMTIVGLRPYKAEAKILPEQTLGRGLRKMFGLNSKEELVVVGTQAFIEFVESLKTEGVEFEYRQMGPNSHGKTPIIIEVDKENVKKDIDALDINIPVLSPRIYREYKNLDLIEVDKLEFKPVGYKTFSEKELKQIVFKDIDDKLSHVTVFSDSVPDYRNVVAFFVKNILMQSRLFSGFDILYPKVEDFIKRKLFGKEADLTNPQTIRNLSEIEAKQTIYLTFKKAIDSLTISDKGTAEVRNYIKLSNTKPIVVNNQQYFPPKKSVFNKIIGDSHFELEFASFLDTCEDIISFAKNHNGIYFKMEYQGTDGNIHDYFPDFFVKTKVHTYIVETKGREDLEDIRKIERLRQWCKDVNAVQNEGTYIPVYVKEEDFNTNRTSIKTFADIVALYRM
jgi:type III restriction enzyme